MGIWPIPWLTIARQWTSQCPIVPNQAWYQLMTDDWWLIPSWYGPLRGRKPDRTRREPEPRTLTRGARNSRHFFRLCYPSPFISTARMFFGLRWRIRSTSSKNPSAKPIRNSEYTLEAATSTGAGAQILLQMNDLSRGSLFFKWMCRNVWLFVFSLSQVFSWPTIRQYLDCRSIAHGFKNFGWILKGSVTLFDSTISAFEEAISPKRQPVKPCVKFLWNHQRHVYIGELVLFPLSRSKVLNLWPVSRDEDLNRGHSFPSQ